MLCSIRKDIEKQRNAKSMYKLKEKKPIKSLAFLPFVHRTTEKIKSTRKTQHIRGY